MMVRFLSDFAASLNIVHELLHRWSGTELLFHYGGLSVALIVKQSSSDIAKCSTSFSALFESRFLLGANPPNSFGCTFQPNCSASWSPRKRLLECIWGVKWLKLCRCEIIESWICYFHIVCCKRLWKKFSWSIPYLYQNLLPQEILSKHLQDHVLEQFANSCWELKSF